MTMPDSPLVARLAPLGLSPEAQAINALQAAYAQLAALVATPQALNVRLGARGDGVTDDTAAIHAARDQAGAGGTLYFPAGVYLVSGLLLSQPGQSWLLDQGAVILLGGTGGGLAALTLAADGLSLTGGTIDGQRQSRIAPARTQPNTLCAGIATTGLVHDLLIAGTTLRHHSWWGLNLGQVIRTRLVGLALSDCVGAGVFLGAGSSDVLVGDCTYEAGATGCPQGGFINAGRVPMTEAPYGPGVIRRLLTVNCTATLGGMPPGNPGGGGGIFYQGVADGAIVGCAMDGASDIGIDLEECDRVSVVGSATSNSRNIGLAAFQGCHGCTITGCSSDNDPIGMAIGDGEAARAQRDNAIIGCAVAGGPASRFGISAAGRAGTISATVIADNRITGLGPPDQNGGAGLYLASLSGALIHHNSVHDVAGAGIQAIGCSDTSIDHNAVLNVGGVAIAVVNPVGGVLDGNIVSGAPAGGVAVQGADSTFVSGRNPTRS